MHPLKALLIHQMQHLLHAETQLTAALPKMSQAARDPKLKEAFQKHLAQTEAHVQRLNKAFEILQEEASSKPCPAMMGLIQEGEDTITESSGKDPLCADLALIAAAQRVEHYEISAYGTARRLARQLGRTECARLLSHTLGEEESTDFLLTSISDPLIQQASLDDWNSEVNLGDERRLRSEKQSSIRRGTNDEVPQGVA